MLASRPDASRRAGDPVVVTFDDGTADLVDVALPILERHRVPATFYLGDGLRRARARRSPGDGRPSSWAGGARGRGATGWSRRVAHPHARLLDRLPPAEAADELDRSRTSSASGSASAADHFAYPKAVAASPEVEPLVRSRFRSASLGGSRPNPYPATDLAPAGRTAVQLSDGTGYFARKAAGGMALEEQLPEGRQPRATALRSADRPTARRRPVPDHPAEAAAPARRCRARCRPPGVRRTPGGALSAAAAHAATPVGVVAEATDRLGQRGRGRDGHEQAGHSVVDHLAAARTSVAMTGRPDAAASIAARGNPHGATAARTGPCPVQPVDVVTHAEEPHPAVRLRSGWWRSRASGFSGSSGPMTTTT